MSVKNAQKKYTNIGTRITIKEREAIESYISGYNKRYQSKLTISELIRISVLNHIEIEPDQKSITIDINKFMKGLEILRHTIDELSDTLKNYKDVSVVELIQTIQTEPIQRRKRES